MQQQFKIHCSDYEIEFARWRAENDRERFVWREPRLSYDEARTTFDERRSRGWRTDQLADQGKRSPS